MTQRIEYTEEMVGNGHPTKSDTLNRLVNVITAAGDILVGTDVATVKKLAKGTACQGLRMNGAGDDLEWGSKNVVQNVNDEDGDLATGTTTTPYDDTIPQKTEGDEFMTKTITPKNSNSLLIIDVTVHGAISPGQYIVIAALFQDDIADALAAGVQCSPTANGTVGIHFRHHMVAGTTSEITFKVRISSDQPGTWTFNGHSGGRSLGGIMASSINVTELAP